MQTTEEEGTCPVPNGQAVKTTENESTLKDKKVIIPFRNRQAERQQGMPLVPGVSSGMQGSKDQGTKSIQPSNNGNLREEMGASRRSRMTPEDLEFFYSAVVGLRKQTVQLLDLLVKYDDGISTADVQQLTKSIQIIKTAKGF